MKKIIKHASLKEKTKRILGELIQLLEAHPGQDLSVGVVQYHFIQNYKVKEPWVKAVITNLWFYMNALGKLIDTFPEEFNGKIVKPRKGIYRWEPVDSPTDGPSEPPGGLTEEELQRCNDDPLYLALTLIRKAEGIISGILKDREDLFQEKK